MTTEISPSELNAARAQGRFEGEVLGALQDIKVTVGEFKQSFKTHIAEDGQQFKDIEIKLDSIKRFMWMLSGGLIVLQAIATYFFSR
jgi:hypothetical protein